MPGTFSQLAFGGSCLSRNDPQLLVFHIPSGYGYVVLTAVGSMFMVMWKGFQVIHECPVNSVTNFLTMASFQSKLGGESTQGVWDKVSNHVFKRQ